MREGGRSFGGMNLATLTRQFLESRKLSGLFAHDDETLRASTEGTLLKGVVMVIVSRARCLVRAVPHNQALERLLNPFQRYGLSIAGSTRFNVDMIAGDFSKPMSGDRASAYDSFDHQHQFGEQNMDASMVLSSGALMTEAEDLNGGDDKLTSRSFHPYRLLGRLR